MMKENKMNEFKGFSLFNDVDDKALRVRNRAIILANMAEDNAKDKRISPKGAALILGYFSQIPEGERGDVKAAFTINMKQRGFRIE